MDNKNKIFFIVFFLLIIGSICATYYRIVVKKDYIVSAQTDCDPYAEKCFIWECDPDSTVEGEACTGDPENDIWYYQIVNRKAFNIPLCDPNDEECDALSCPEEEEDCGVIFCDETNKEEQGAECNDPVQYTIDNPEEDSEECEEDDCEEVACDSETEDCAVEEGDVENADEAEDTTEESIEDTSSERPVFPVEESQPTE